MTTQPGDPSIFAALIWSASGIAIGAAIAAILHTLIWMNRDEPAFLPKYKAPEKSQQQIDEQRQYEGGGVGAYSRLPDLRSLASLRVKKRS